MKIYLAARYGRREELIGYAEKLRELGHEITAGWLGGTYEGDHATDEDYREWAEEDLRDIARSDMLIYFAEPQRETIPSNHASGGRHVEVGFALAKYMEVVLVGERENIFHWHSLVSQFRCFDDLVHKSENRVAGET